MPPAPRTPSTTPKRRSGKTAALLFLALWVILLIAVYIVIVKLQIGGKESIQLPDGSPEAPSAESIPDSADS